MSASNISNAKKASTRTPKLAQTPSCQFTIPRRLTSSRQIFEKNTLSNACDFLTQLKQKLELEVDGIKSDKERETNSLNNLLVTLMDVSDTLTPLMVNRSASCADMHPESMISEREFNRTMEATSKLVDFNTKTEHYYVSQQITLNNVQAVVKPISNRNVDNKRPDKKNSEKLFIDKTLLTQLEQLHELLRDTISKLLDKTNYNYEKDEETKVESNSNTAENTVADTLAYESNTSPEYSEDEELMKMGTKSTYMTSEEERTAAYRKECEELIDYIRAAAETTGRLPSIDPENSILTNESSLQNTTEEKPAEEQQQLKNVHFKSNTAMTKLPGTLVYHQLTEPLKSSKSNSERISNFFSPSSSKSSHKSDKWLKNASSKESKTSRDSLSSRLSRFPRFSKKDRSDSKKAKKSKEPLHDAIKEVRESEDTSSKFSNSECKKVDEDQSVNSEAESKTEDDSKEFVSTDSTNDAIEDGAIVNPGETNDTVLGEEQIRKQQKEDVKKEDVKKEDVKKIKVDDHLEESRKTSGTEVLTESSGHEDGNVQKQEETATDQQEETTNAKTATVKQEEATNVKITKNRTANINPVNIKQESKHNEEAINLMKKDVKAVIQLESAEEIRRRQEIKIIETQSRWWMARQRREAQEIRAEREQKQSVSDVKDEAKEANKRKLLSIKREIKEVIKKQSSESSASRRSSFGRRFSFSRKSKDKSMVRTIPETPFKVVMYTDRSIQNVSELREASVAKSLTKVMNKKVGAKKDTKFSGVQTDERKPGGKAPPASPISSTSSRNISMGLSIPKDHEFTTVDGDETDSYAGVIPAPDDSQFSFLKIRKDSMIREYVPLKSETTSTTEAELKKEYLYSPASVTIFQASKSKGSMRKGSKESTKGSNSSKEGSSSKEVRIIELQSQPEPEPQKDNMVRERSTTGSIVLPSGTSQVTNQVTYLDPVVSVAAREHGTSMTSVTDGDSTTANADARSISEKNEEDRGVGVDDQYVSPEMVKAALDGEDVPRGYNASGMERSADSKSLGGQEDADKGYNANGIRKSGDSKSFGGTEGADDDYKAGGIRKSTDSKSFGGAEGADDDYKAGGIRKSTDSKSFGGAVGADDDYQAGGIRKSTDSKSFGGREDVDRGDNASRVGKSADSRSLRGDEDAGQGSPKYISTDDGPGMKNTVGSLAGDFDPDPSSRSPGSKIPNEDAVSNAGKASIKFAAEDDYDDADKDANMKFTTEDDDSRSGRNVDDSNKKWDDSSLNTSEIAEKLAEIADNFHAPPGAVPLSKVEVDSVSKYDDNESTMTESESTKRGARGPVYYQQPPLSYDGPKAKSANEKQATYRHNTRQRYQAYDPTSYESQYQNRKNQKNDDVKKRCKCHNRHTQTSRIVNEMEEVNFLDKNSPGKMSRDQLVIRKPRLFNGRYFETILSQMEMMKYCIEFAFEHKLNVHEKLVGYADDESMPFPHFHTVVDGIPVMLTWRQDPNTLFAEKPKDRSETSKVIREWRRMERMLNRKPRSGIDNRSVDSTSQGARMQFQSMLRPCINFMKGKPDEPEWRPGGCVEGKEACKINSCGEGRRSCTTKSESGGPLRWFGTGSSREACVCEDAGTQSDFDAQHKTVQKHKRKPRKSTSFAVTEDDEATEHMDKSTNAPSMPSVRTYYVTTSKKSDALDPFAHKRYDSESDNEMPYLIDAASLPHFECPETVCSSKKFNVDDANCKMLNGTGQYNSVKEALLTIDVHSILDSFKPAKCCQKVVMNGRNRSRYPYPASLQSLPLSEEDLDRILEIIQSNQKRFDTVKRLYESTFNFQRGTDAACDQVYFFELFRKAEVKVSTATTSSSLSSTRSSSTTRHDLKIFEFLRRIYSNNPIVEKAMPKRRKDATKTLYRHKRHHKKRQRSKHRSKKAKRITSSSSIVPSRISSLTMDNYKQPMRNISFLLIPKSELNNFCGEINSMYSPSLTSLPCDDISQCNSCMQDIMIGDESDSMVLTPADYARTLSSICEQDEAETPPRVKLSNTPPVQACIACIPPNKRVANFEIMTCTVSSSATVPSKDELKSSSSTSSNTLVPELSLTRKSVDSDLSIKKHLFSSSSIIGDNCGGKAMSSCLPIGCTLRDNKSAFLGFPNIIPEAKRFLHRQKEEFFKPNLDRIIENSSETNSAISSQPSRAKVKPHNKDRDSSCSMDSTSQSSQKIKFKVVKSAKKSNRVMNNYDLPIAFEFVHQPSGMKGKHNMKIDKAVVAYAINPKSEFTFLDDGCPKPSQQKTFKSENICVWPVFQQRSRKKKNNAFVVAIHSSAVRINNPVNGTHQHGDQSNVNHGDFCDLGQKINNLSTDNFVIGYIGDEGKKSESRKPRREKDEKVEKEHKRDKEKSRTSRKDSSPNVKLRKGARKKSSRKIVPELIDIKIPANVKATRLKHKFCQNGDRPGYVTVLRTPCNCPDVTIFIPCYCQQCDGKPTKDGRPKSESDYAMVPIVEHDDVQSI